VITAIGNVLAEYDYDKMFPVYGFGAQLPPDWVLSNCFPLNNDVQKPEVLGIQGILDVYRKTLLNVRLHGPSVLSEVLKAVNEKANYNVTQHNQKYFILLLITDGVISDMEASIELLVKAASLPLSIVIVGIGNDNFDDLKKLDADDAAVRKESGIFRDIVQFVSFRDFKDKPLSALAEETLAEIPGQLTEFLKVRGFVPNMPRKEKSATPLSPS